MPNVVVEYTANIRAEADIPALLKTINRTVQEAGRGAFAVAAVRVRALCCEDYVIGDDDPDYAFVIINVRLAKGRAEEDVRRTFDAVWQAVKAHLASVSARRMLAISMDVEVRRPPGLQAQPPARALRHQADRPDGGELVRGSRRCCASHLTMRRAFAARLPGGYATRSSPHPEAPAQRASKDAGRHRRPT
ncbi:MAG: hypothetical protein WDM92_14285 [Caulobacteraceae bacterium]